MSQENSPDFLGGLGAELVVAFHAVKRGVRREQDILVLAKTLVFKRFDLDDIKPGTRDVARFKRLKQGCLVNQGATRRVDQHGSRAHLGDGLPVDHVPV